VTELTHKPVLLPQVLEALRPRAGSRLVDGTIGLGGHASALLMASAPDGLLLGCDLDGAALEIASRRLEPFTGRFELQRMNFAGLAQWIQPGSCGGMLLDLGVSSAQLDSPARGFSFQNDGPLDMRMDCNSPMTAATLCNTASAAELARMFADFSDEPHARRIARAIESERQSHTFETTGQLARLVERINPRCGSRSHPATRVFQALRMAVNDELASLRSGLAAALEILAPGGRLAVITFHSIEDRITKNFGRDAARDYSVPGAEDIPELRQARQPLLRVLTRKPVVPDAAEIAANPRARSAQLRVFEKL